MKFPAILLVASFPHPGSLRSVLLNARFVGKFQPHAEPPPRVQSPHAAEARDNDPAHAARWPAPRRGRAACRTDQYRQARGPEVDDVGDRAGGEELLPDPSHLEAHRAVAAAVGVDAIEQISIAVL